MTLQEWRNEMDLSLRECADRMGVKPSWLYDLECGKVFLPERDHTWTRFCVVDLTKTEYDFSCMARESAQVYKNGCRSEGPTVTISCGPNGCRVSHGTGTAGGGKP